MDQASERITRVGLVGGGVIGAGWAARLVLAGIDVALYDPDPEAERKVEAVLGNARRAWAKLRPGATPEGRLALVPTIEDAVAGAGLVQESLPDREDLKRRVLAQIDRAAEPEAIVASSTSGLPPSTLQADMARPERFLVGHPFNPVYLLPLVELCAGKATADATMARAARFYAGIGMHPLEVRAEIDGFIANRLQEALWREALWMIRDGVATAAEIDDALRFGPGLRWAFMGSFLSYRLAGGEGGMRHFLHQFAPSLAEPWARVVAPELTPELTETIVAQSDEQAGEASIRDLERVRDDCLVAVLAGLREVDYGAGRSVGPT